MFVYEEWQLTHTLSQIVLYYALIWKENCFNARMWLASFFHIIIMIIAVMYLLSLLIIGVCLHKVYSHKNYKGRKRIIVRYKETILIIMYKRTWCLTKSWNNYEAIMKKHLKIMKTNKTIIKQSMKNRQQILNKSINNPEKIVEKSMKNL